VQKSHNFAKYFAVRITAIAVTCTAEIFDKLEKYLQTLSCKYKVMPAVVPFRGTGGLSLASCCSGPNSTTGQSIEDSRWTGGQGERHLTE